MSGKIVKVSGPLVVATGLADANMADVVRVGEDRLIGEVLTMTGDSASIQVYEETSGLGPGAAVVTTGSPLSVELGPGIIENIYDGIQRPLEEIMKKVQGNNLPRGVEVPSLNRERKWDFTATANVGDKVTGGDVIGTVQETSVVLHKIMIPPKMSGTIESITSGSFTVEETVAVLVDEKGEKHNLTMMQKWPVRVGRPYKHKYPPRPPCCPVSASWMPCSPLPRAAPLPSPAPLVPARPSCSISWPSGPTWTSWSTSAAASAATR